MLNGVQLSIQIRVFNWMRRLIIGQWFASRRSFTCDKHISESSAAFKISAHTFAIFQLTASPPVLADAAPSTLLALTALSPVLTEAASSALLARTALPPVLADAAPFTLLAPTANSPMLADACPSALTHEI